MIEIINPVEFNRQIREKIRQAIIDYTELEMIPRPDNENMKLLQRPAFFRGLLKYISLRIFCPPGKIPEMKSAEPWQLYAVWNEYFLLCSNFNQSPVLELYCDTIGINPDNIRRWSNGTRKIYSTGNNADKPDHKEIADKILYSIRGIYKDKIINENNYNTVFLLKNEYQYTDNNIVTITAKDPENAQTIAARHTALLEDKPGK